MGPLSIEQVLAAEAAAIHDLSKPEIKAVVDRLLVLASDQKLETERANKDADIRSGKNEDREWVANRRAFYCELGQLKSAALCCSGGGIRSATFCLGIIQALAKASLATLPHQPATLPDPDKTDMPELLEQEANLSFLSRFHYLSTVSGGGYIGSWLSAWRSRDDFPTVWQNLRSRPDGPDVEPPELSWLRSYSNFLTPHVGLLSADTWTGIAIYLRNLLLNWLVIIPAIAVVLLVLKFMITGAVEVARLDDVWWPLALFTVIGVALLIVAQAFTIRHRPTRRPPPPADCVTTPDPYNATQQSYQFNDLLWSGLSAFFITGALTSKTGAMLAGEASGFAAILIGALVAVPVFAAGWLAGWPYHKHPRDFIAWAASGLIYGGLVGLGAHLYTLMMPYSNVDPPWIWHILVPVIFGVPWVLLSQLFAEMIFVGLTSYERNSDSDREWLGRAAGWTLAIGIIWMLTTFISFAGGYVLIDLAPAWTSQIVAGVGGVSGILTAVIGKSGTASKSKAGEKGEGSLWSKIGLAIAGPLFAAVLVVGVSIALDLLLLGDSLMKGLTDRLWDYAYILKWLGIGFLAAYAVAWLASRRININRFSIHALYRNRLVRAYLGASRQERCPDRFTGFDDADNLKAYQLWPPRRYEQTKRNTLCLFHVVNITLNVVKATRLAWQQRKAVSFTVSPLHSGAAYKGYRCSAEYGGDNGISLGTAMAISGAAASPNMGYHSNTSTALLLALFNVRLGWWLGNPGKEGNGTFTKEGPRTAIRPLAEETFGLTTDNKPWVYLSDGGHFENLGIYEMVRRRCRFILAIDAGCDPDFAFEDLGNALRKTYIDLGVRIEFKHLDQLRNRPSADVLEKAVEQSQKIDEDKRPRSPIPYYSIGTIDYCGADGEKCDNGVILYIKPAYHGTSAIEGAGVRSYADANEAFPHEPTADQWFSESQFESYRSLALDIAGTLMEGEKIFPGANATLAEMLASLSPTALRAPA